jgi:hypothetical protein
MLNDKQIEQAKKYLIEAKKTTMKCAKYGAVFGGGVLVGTICGVVLFFSISNDPI